MVKKVKKKISKAKSQPVHFKNLNFDKKIISIILIVLIIGVIASFFPGEGITGMVAPEDEYFPKYDEAGYGKQKSSRTGFAGSFGLLKDALSEVNGLITFVFGKFFPGEEIQITYVRFVLFALVVGLIYLLMKSFFGSQNTLINIMVGIAIAYLATFFTPMEAILTTGLLYSSTFMGIILFIPFIILWLLYFKAPKTKPGYILRIFFLFLIWVLIVNFEDVFKIKTISFMYDVISIFVVFTWLGIIWSAIRFFTVTGVEAAESRAISKGIPILKGTIYDWIGKAAEKISKGRGGGFSGGGGI